MKLKDAVLLYRAKNKLSQADFARVCGLSAPTIYNIETVGQKPSPITRAKIILAIGNAFPIDEEEEEE